MTENDEQELHEFIRLKHHSNEFTNQQLGQFSLFRDQGVGGSNPLSPTNLFNNFQQEATLDSCLGTHSLSADLGRSALGCGFLCVLAMAAEAASTARVTASTRSYHQLLPQAFWVTSVLAWPMLSRTTSGLVPSLNMRGVHATEASSRAIAFVRTPGAYC